MLIWITVLVLMGLFAAIGYYKGAVRMAVSIVGLGFAALLAWPLAPVFKPLLPMMGVTQLWLLWLLPPVIAFAVVSLIFIGGSFYAHYQAELFYKYRADDYQRLRWERLNQALGLCLGLFVGAAWALILGVAVYVAGYATTQVAGADAPNTYLRLLNQARADLREAGFEKAVARFDSAPAKYYEVADLVGLIYHNPVVDMRLETYPPLLSYSERKEFQDLASDTQLNEARRSQGDVVEMLKNPKVQAVINNPELVDQLLQLDLRDLRDYLETGKSTKFEEEKLLGRWRAEPYATLMRERRDLPSSEMNRLKKMILAVVPGINLVATADNRVAWKLELTDQAKQAVQGILSPQSAAPVAVRAASAEEGGGGRGPGAVSPEMAARYGLGRRAAAAPPPTTAAAPARPTTFDNPIGALMVTGQGTWKREGDRYQIQFQNEKGKEETMTAQVVDERLVLSRGGHTLVFLK